MSRSPAASAQTASVEAVTWVRLVQNLGAAAFEGQFTLIDAAIDGTSNVVVVPTASTDEALADEATMDPLFCVAVAGDGEATVYWTTMGQGPVAGEKAFLYTVA